MAPSTPAVAKATPPAAVSPPAPQVQTPPTVDVHVDGPGRHFLTPPSDAIPIAAAPNVIGLMAIAPMTAARR